MQRGFAHLAHIRAQPGRALCPAGPSAAAYQVRGSGCGGGVLLGLVQYVCVAEACWNRLGKHVQCGVAAVVAHVAPAAAHCRGAGERADANDGQRQECCNNELHR
jgi:hypothetical protein